MRRVCVFCGAHRGNDNRYETAVGTLSAALVDAGYTIVYGGGRVGLMGAVADAALEAGGAVIGVIPRSLATREVAHDGITELHVVDTMHERKALMVQLADAFVALPGGFGTMDEFHEILTWRQLGIHNKPIALFNLDGYYDALLSLFDTMEREGFLRRAVRELFASVETVAELIAAIEPRAEPDA